jgi:hypothetical protein
LIALGIKIKDKEEGFSIKALMTPITEAKIVPFKKIMINAFRI